MEERSKTENIQKDRKVPTAINLAVFHATGRYKSVRRAMRRGHCTVWGEIVPKRPFNNSKRTPGRKLQTEKQRIYEQLKHKQLLHGSTGIAE